MILFLMTDLQKGFLVSEEKKTSQFIFDNTSAKFQHVTFTTEIQLNMNKCRLSDFN